MDAVILLLAAIRIEIHYDVFLKLNPEPIALLLSFKQIMGQSFWSMLMIIICWSKTVNKNKEALLYVTKEVGLEVKAKKTKFMFMSRHQNAGLNHNLMMANKSSENVASFKYLRASEANEYFTHKEIII
jgi:hypothetical protein